MESSKIPQPIPQLDTAAIGPPITRLGVSFFPIYLPGNELPEITTGDSADCAINELDDAEVPSLAVHNRGETPALLVEGEHFLGGKQNRTVNVTVLVPAATRLEIPVSCLERGRWGRSREYSRARTLTPPRVRSLNQRHIHASMRAAGSRRGNQSAVWAGVDRVLRDVDAHSPTDAAVAADAVYERDRTRSGAVAELTRLGPLPGQCGVAVSHGRWITAIELFGAPHLFAAHWSAIVRSHLMEPARPDGRPSPSSTLRMLGRFATLSEIEAEGVGLGIEHRGQGRWITGQALSLDGAFVHGAAFTRERAAEGSQG